VYEIYCKLRDEKGVKDADVARGTGIGKSTFSDWKSGRSAPKNEKLFKIAEYFGVPADVFGVNNTVEFDAKKIIRAYHKNESYYENEETARLAQEALEDSDMRILLSAKKDLKPDDFKMIVDMVKRFKETNKDG
jgi:transcriptional regulator with XRE-family HTH domain